MQILSSLMSSLWDQPEWDMNGSRKLLGASPVSVFIRGLHWDLKYKGVPRWPQSTLRHCVSYQLVVFLAPVEFRVS